MQVLVQFWCAGVTFHSTPKKAILKGKADMLSLVNNKVHCFLSVKLRKPPIEQFSFV